MDISRSKMVTLYGINYKDKQKSAIEWLNNLGDPYKNIGRDSDGRTAIDWGVYGVPETYLVDRNGRIQYRHVGPLSEKVFNEKLAPMIIALQKNTNE
jgi:cytochrome c biogenesis protein CcmG/thiol:disulfide interchange protein DsbE